MNAFNPSRHVFNLPIRLVAIKMTGGEAGCLLRRLSILWGSRRLFCSAVVWLVEVGRERSSRSSDTLFYSGKSSKSNRVMSR